jgi:cytochrome c oxidase assembly factor CtaG
VNLWSNWTFDPVLAGAMILAGWLYYRGVARLWSRPAASALPPWRAECFAAGLAIVLVALISPLDALSSALFSAHMVQHLLLIAAAAPLLVLGRPCIPILAALPASVRRALIPRLRAPKFRSGLSQLCRPVIVWMVATATLWLWHMPWLYEAALRSAAVHATEHGLLLASAALFWFAVLPVGKRRDRSAVSSRQGMAIIALVAMALQGMLLGIALAFSRSPWYASYATTTAAWGLSPIEDQQIAGLIMWIPASAVYFAAALALIGRAIAGPGDDIERHRGMSTVRTRLPL